MNSQMHTQLRAFYTFFSYYLVNFISLNKISSPQPTKCFSSLSFPVYRGLKRTIVIYFIFFRHRRTLLAAIWRSESCVWKLDVSREMKWSVRQDRLGPCEGWSERGVAVKTFTMIFFICHPYVSQTMLSLEKSFARACTLTHLKHSICTRFSFFSFFFLS